MLDAARVLFIWVALLAAHRIDSSKGEMWSEWSWLELGGFVVVTLGLFTYNKVIQVGLLAPACALGVSGSCSCCGGVFFLVYLVSWSRFPLVVALFISMLNCQCASSSIWVQQNHTQVSVLRIWSLVMHAVVAVCMFTP